MLNDKHRPKFSFLVLAVVAIILFRFVLTFTIPLLDRTEARYAEIARLMVETGEWVVLQIDYNIPFWAKPPLSTWLSALSFKLFGINELAARLPSFLLSISLIFILHSFVKKRNISFFLLAFVLVTTPQYLLHAGVVSTDTVLAFCVTMMMLSFWKAMSSENSLLWKYLFFVFLGLGLLAKGPLVLVLTGPPLFVWALLQKDVLKQLLTKLPWLIGLPITLLIAMPWYFLTEQRSPGFVDYFIVGEHFNRFLESGWRGDLYGKPKSQAIGMIWLFLMAFAFPWVQIVFYWLWKRRKEIWKDKWISFLTLWLLWTPLFFTLSKNVLHTYILPVMAPVALIICCMWHEYRFKKLALGIASVFPIVVFITFLFIYTPGRLDFYLNTDKHFMVMGNLNNSKNTQSVYYWKNKSYSGQFYSHGKAELIKDTTTFEAILSENSNKYYVVIDNDDIKKMPWLYFERLEIIHRNYRTTLFVHKDE
ncbi:glycosyltransferase family 39 protein [Fulvivirgaceae bacterium BMA10]|uniref:Glycosyltransferase family 39 protein n=1 Tax=Splendidivirga corallicola TaxID=3051826 RepID=A0ABT8KVS6_9BACT|nr:glycosyltransferase family 39 protein [Fulvivirgaceae bacterium BMA10]